MDSASEVEVLAEERMELEASAEGNFPGRWPSLARMARVFGWKIDGKTWENREKSMKTHGKCMKIEV